MRHLPADTLRRSAPALLCAIVLLLTLNAPAQAAAPLYEAPVISTGGAVMGTAVVEPLPSGAMRVRVVVSGFQPVGGDHRLAIAETGTCCPPTFVCADGEVAVLPPIQFYPDGSANYETTTFRISKAELTEASGSALLIYANTSPPGKVIACAVIVPPRAAPPQPRPPLQPVAPPTTVTAPLGLRLRQRPDLGSAVLRVLPRGARVVPLRHPVVSQGIRWSLVRTTIGGRTLTGYVASTYLAAYGGGAPAGDRYRVAAPAGLRLRQGPGLGYRTRTMVPRGTILRATGAERTADGFVWTQVAVDGDLLWAAKSFLRRI
jgi:hypothetical protein